jgi:4-hydroxy-tetrahydrodipicolinate synthase
MVGNDVVFARARQAGADGVVSGVASAIPELMVGLDRAIRAGDQERIALLSGRLDEFIRWADLFPAPTAVKMAAATRGLKVGPLAVPLGPESQKHMDEFTEWFKGWLPTVQGECRV